MNSGKIAQVRTTGPEFEGARRPALILQVCWTTTDAITALITGSERKRLWRDEINLRLEDSVPAPPLARPRVAADAAHYLPIVGTLADNRSDRGKR